MKIMKKLLPVLLCLALVAAFALTASAAATEPNVTISVNVTEVNVGDTVTVKLGITEMTASSVAFGFDFDNTLLSVTSITTRNCKLTYEAYDADVNEYYDEFVSATTISTKEEMNEDGHFGVAFANANEYTYYQENALVTIKFTALKAGTVEFEMFEDSAGTDGYKAKWIEEAATVTIKEAASCDHVGKTYTYTSNGNDTHKVTCECGETVNAAEACTGGTANCSYKAECEKCGVEYGDYNENIHFSTTDPFFVPNEDGKTHEVWSGCWNCNEMITQDAEADDCFDNDNNGKCDACEYAMHVCTPADYIDNKDGKNHTVKCACGETIKTEKHNFANDEHKCVCGVVETFTLEVMNVFDGSTIAEIQVPYGAKIMDYLKNVTVDPIYLNNENCELKREHSGFVGVLDQIVVSESTTMPAERYGIEPTYVKTGWDYGRYYVKDVLQKTGWTQIFESAYLENADEDDYNWYYLDPKTGYRAEGVSRVPYPTVEIYGNYYRPDENALKYYAEKGMEFVDANEAWFWFTEDGHFGAASGCHDELHFYSRGMQVWNPGFEDGYYFIGDEENGGNKLAQGDIYIMYPNSSDLIEGAIYHFTDGELSGYNGVVGGKYYVGSRLMIGNGLTAITVENETKFIYVRSDGKLAIGQYWVTNTNGLCNAGMYDFGENGYLTIENPDLNGIHEGVYYKNGVPYYAGLIEIDGDYYYVKSNGQVVTNGWYYVSKTNGIDLGTTKLYFGEDGKMQSIKNGFYTESDVLYYYVGNHKQYGLGLTKIGEDLYYIRSNGEVVTGYYYVTLTNGIDDFNSGDKCFFDEQGKFVKNYSAK